METKQVEERGSNRVRGGEVTRQREGEGEEGEGEKERDRHVYKENQQADKSMQKKLRLH